VSHLRRPAVVSEGAWCGSILVEESDGNLKGDGVNEPARSEEGEETFPMLAKPFGAVLGLVPGLIVVVPVALLVRERYRRDHRAPAHGAVR
jgi:hypothetical protein